MTNDGALVECWPVCLFLLWEQCSTQILSRGIECSIFLREKCRVLFGRWSSVKGGGGKFFNMGLSPPSPLLNNINKIALLVHDGFPSGCTESDGILSLKSRYPIPESEPLL